MKIVDLAEHAQTAKLYPAVAHAAGEVGTPQIRNAGTVGGNLNQRPRCWYFRAEDFNCYKKGGNRCFSPAGENQYHAIFGNDGPSHIVHPSSLAVPFTAYGATFRVVGPNGERIVPASDFFTVVLTMNGNTIRAARVVLGAVAPIPWRSTDAEQALVGKPLNEATAVAAAEAAVKAAKPLSRNGYKVQITKTAVKRAIMQIAGLKPVQLRA